MEHTTGQQQTPEEPAVWERPLPWLRETDSEGGTASGAGSETDSGAEQGSGGEADDAPDAGYVSAPDHESAPAPTPTPARTPVSAPAPAAADRGPAAPATGPDGASAPDAATAPAALSDGAAEPRTTEGRGLFRPREAKADEAGARGEGGAAEVQPERGARVAGAVVAAGALLVLGLGGVAFMALPSHDDPGPQAAAVGDGAVPQLAAGGSAEPTGSPSASAGGRPAHGTKKAQPGKANGVDSAGSSPAESGKAHPGRTTSDTQADHTAAGKGSAATGKATASGGGTATAAGNAIVGYGSSKCIEVSAHAGTVGSPLRLWGCDGDAWQKWVFKSDGSVRSMGLCLGIAGSSKSNGAAIRLATCNGGWAQRFTLNSSHDLVNTVIGKCVDAKDQGTGNGTPLQLWDCGGTSNQKWYLK